MIPTLSHTGCILVCLGKASLMTPTLSHTGCTLACLGKASCSKNSSVKVLRCQLPRENAFYPYEPDDKAIAVVAADTQVRGWTERLNVYYRVAQEFCVEFCMAMQTNISGGILWLSCGGIVQGFALATPSAVRENWIFRSVHYAAPCSAKENIISILIPSAESCCLRDLTQDLTLSNPNPNLVLLRKRQADSSNLFKPPPT